MDYAFSYIASSGGLHTEEAYPYLMEEGSCGDGKKSESEAVAISGYEDVPTNDELALIKALAHQPISVAIEASGRHFQFYSGVSIHIPSNVSVTDDMWPHMPYSCWMTFSIFTLFMLVEVLN
jgi:hypothetical protein